MTQIKLPWPPQATSVNGSQGKWRAKAGAAKDYKKTCAKLCWANGAKPVDYPVHIDILFLQPANVPRYDLDNTLARAKQGLDAVAEAIGVDDAEWRSMTLTRGPKGGDGGIMVTVRPYTPNAVLVPMLGEIT